MKKSIPPVLITVSLVCFALCPLTQAVVPPPDGGYPGFNTAEGQNALFSLTTGAANTAVGWFSLWSNAEGGFNTATGAGTLFANIADGNTATGAGALLSNTTGDSNTANGTFALFNNTEGRRNNAFGSFALENHETGDHNNAFGSEALSSDTNGFGNNAFGDDALRDNTGSSNTAIGDRAGYALTTGSFNVCIGASAPGVAGVSNTTWISNVYSSVATTRQVCVNSDNKIGTLSSSRRYKEGTKPMNNTSEALFALKPVTFRYKKQIDPMQALSFGLIAEEVAEINPELITRDKDGKPETVRYEAVNAMLLNEFLKAHCRMEQQDKRIEELTAQLKEQAAQIQKVSARLEASKPAPQVVNNQ